MFPPIPLINIHIVFKVLVQQPINPFYWAIGLPVKCHTKKQFCPHLLRQMLFKTCHKFDISIIYTELKQHMVPNPHVKEQFC